MDARRLNAGLPVLALTLLGCIEGPEPVGLFEVTPARCETALQPTAVFELMLTGADVAGLATDLERDPPSFRLQTSDGIELPHALVVDLPTLNIQPNDPLPLDSDITIEVTSLGALDQVNMMDRFFPINYSTQSKPRIRNWVVNDGMMFISFSQPLDPESLSGSAVRVRQNGVEMGVANITWLANINNALQIQFLTGRGPAELELLSELRSQDGLVVFSVPETIVISELGHSVFDAAVGECDDRF